MNTLFNNTDAKNIFDINDEQLIKQMIAKLLEINDIELLKKLFKLNDTAGNMNTKELNSLFHVDGYRFIKAKKRTTFQVGYYLKYHGPRKINRLNDKLMNLANELTSSTIPSSDVSHSI